MTKKLAIFDLDGTILDTLADLSSALNLSLRKYGFPERTAEQARLSIGGGFRKMIDRSIEENVSSEKKDAVYRSFVERYASHFMDETRPYDTVPELLRRLKNSGWRLAVVTNKDARMAQPMCEAFFPGVFDLVVGQVPGLRTKPAPDGVESVLNALSVPARDSVYIGDSEVDAETAKNADMDFMIVSWGYRTVSELEAFGIHDPVPDPGTLLSRLL